MFALLAAFLSLVSGAVAGWFAALVVQPVQQINELRRQTQEAILIYGRLHADAPPAERQAAAEMFTRIGSGLVSHYFTQAPWTPWAMRWFSWRTLDIHSAGEILWSFGHDIRFKGMSNPAIHPGWSFVQRALALPPVTASPVVHALLEAAGQPAPMEPSSQF